MSVDRVSSTNQVPVGHQMSPQPVRSGRDGHRTVSQGPNAGRPLPPPPLPQRDTSATSTVRPPRLPPRNQTSSSGASATSSVSSAWTSVRPSSTATRRPQQLLQAQLRIPATPQELRAMKSSAPEHSKLPVVSTAALKAKFGEPQKNRKLFGIVGPRIIPRGRIYRGMLNRIDQHQSAIAETTMATDGKVRAKQIRKLDSNLQSLEKLIAKRMSSGSSSELVNLKGMIGRERRLLSQLDTGRDLPPMSFQQAIDMKHRGLPPAALRDLQLFNASTETARTQLGSGAVNAVDRVTYAHQPAQPMVYKSTPPIDPAMEKPGVAIGISKIFPNYAARNVATSVVSSAMGLDVIPETRFARNGDDLGTVMAMVDGKSPLDSVGTQAPSTAQHGRIMSARSDFVQEMSVDPEEADSSFAERIHPKFTIDAATNLFMTDVKFMAQLDTKDPVLLNRLNDLLWVDLVTGQADRHPGNYMIELDNTGNISGLKGIDNDFCFGSKLRNLEEKAPWSPVGGTKLPGLPPLIDSNTRDALRAMADGWDKAGGMAEKLSELLRPDEVDAARARLFATTDGPEGFTGLLQHIENLEADGRVVPAGQWDSWTDANGDSAHDVMANSGASYLNNLEHQKTIHQQVLAGA